MQRRRVLLRVWELPRPEGVYFRAWRNTEDDAKVLLQGPKVAVLSFLRNIIPKLPGDPRLVSWSPLVVLVDGAKIMDRSEVLTYTPDNVSSNRTEEGSARRSAQSYAAPS